MKKRLFVLLLAASFCLTACGDEDVQRILSEAKSNSGSSSGGYVGSFPERESKWEDWDKSSGGGTNPDQYPWEDESNDPDLSLNPDIPEYSGGTEDDNGENGDTWQLPEYSVPGLPFTDEDLNIPSMPN